MQCSYDSLLKSPVSFEGHKAVLKRPQGFLAIHNTVTELICERFVKFWTFFVQTPHDSYIFCFIILQMLNVFSWCLPFCQQSDRRQKIVRQQNRTSDMNKAVRFVWKVYAGCQHDKLKDQRVSACACFQKFEKNRTNLSAKLSMPRTYLHQ